MSDQVDKLPEQETDSFPCPACGGQMRFDPGSQMLKCGYCDNAVELKSEGMTIQEYDFETAGEQASHDWGVGTVTVHCNSCGANSVMDKAETANFCAYCGSSHVVQEEDDAGIRPESLIPFKIDRVKANQEFDKWIRKKWMAPRALKNEHKTDRLTGVYVPHWTYDASTSSYYHCEVGHDYYVTETYTTTEDGKVVTKTRQVRKTRWYPKSGHHGESFDDILINASGKFYHEKMEKLEPFYLKDLVPYQPEYLSGFIAEKYAVNLQEGFTRAQGNMENTIRTHIIQKQHADHVRGLRVQTSFDDITYKHLLLPVWISSYIFNEKTYQYMVNGQTGEVQGEAPISWMKIALIVIALLGVIGLIILFANMNGPVPEPGLG